MPERSASEQRARQSAPQPWNPDFVGMRPLQTRLSSITNPSLDGMS